MADLQIGDWVRTCDGKYSLVYSFFHKHIDLNAQYLRITTADKRDLEVSSDHFVFANGRATRAAEIQVGDHIPSRVIAITHGISRIGVYAPVTLAGNLVVSGACVSSYVALWETATPWGDAVQNWAMHAAMAMYRLPRKVMKVKESYDLDTGIGTQYSMWVSLIGRLQRMGGKWATLFAAIPGLPYLALVYGLESLVNINWRSINCLLFLLSALLLKACWKVKIQCKDSKRKVE